LNFGSVNVGSSSTTLTVTMTNTSSAVLNTNATSATGDVDQFNANGPGSTCGSTLAAGASCTSRVYFSPTSGGSKTAVWTMAGATLTLTGIATTNLTITPSALSFGGVPVGSGSSLAFTVTNPGTSAIALAAPAITGTDVTQFAIIAGTSTCGSSLAAGATCSAFTSFQPTSGGAKTATLTMGSLTAPMTGSGVVTPLVISPSTLDFGSVAVGNISSALTLTMTNVSSVYLNINATSVTGDITQFNASGPGSNCGSSLDAGASCTRVITFTPTSAGTKTVVWTLAGSTLTFTGTATATPVYRINCGSSSVVTPFAADQYASGGTQHSVTNTINVTGVTNAAPQAVYQSERYGNLTYTFPSLTASAGYTVRLHFAELYWTAAGKRTFGVAINGTTVLSNFDIYASAGANYKAVVREFTTTANASGQIIVNLTKVTDNASISGIEILK
jgi:hypothetical protein